MSRLRNCKNGLSERYFLPKLRREDNRALARATVELHRTALMQHNNGRFGLGGRACASLAEDGLGAVRALKRIIHYPPEKSPDMPCGRTQTGAVPES